MSNQSNIPRWHTAFKAAACVSALAAFLALTTSARAQVESENFNSGVLSGSWATITSATFPNTISFVPDVFGGQAIRLQGSPPLNATNAVARGWAQARCLAIDTDNSYTDFYASADLVSWSTNANSDTNYQLAGVFARCTGSLDSGTNWSAVGLFYWTDVDTHSTIITNATSTNNVYLPAAGVVGLGYVASGLLDITTDGILGGFVPVGGLGPSALSYITLEPGHSYRFVLQGVSSNLFGTVYDLQDLTAPLLTVYGDTSISDLVLPGQTGRLVPPAPTSGHCGVGALACALDGNNTSKVTDATFDNFYAAASPPTSVSAPATPHGVVAAPQVVNRTPASWANFYNTANGITFTATTLSATNNVTNAVLVLNGVNVSSGLHFGTALPATSSTVTFSDLVTNQVYDANIILADQLGRRTTNFFTFDTFNAAYLASTTSQNIECEDYDISGGPIEDSNGGVLYPFPSPTPASGFSTNDNSWYIPNGASAPLSYMDAINGIGQVSQYGYVGWNGVADTTPDGSGGIGFDYYTPGRTAPLVGQPANLITALIGGGSINNVLSFLPGCEYRNGAVQGGFPNFLGAAGGDYVGTAEGAAYALSIVKIMQGTSPGTIEYNIAYDTKRQKYADLSALGPVQNAGYLPPATGSGSASWWDVEEYNVVVTESAHWMNYSRPWGTATNSWLVYLRNACGATETANLYLGATTNRANLLGTFSTTNSLRWNWRYTPLLDASGKPKAVQLGTSGGGSQTLRLEIDPTQVDYPYIQDGVALNYMAFVPYVAGSLTVTISPTAAATAGAQWQVDGGTLQNTGATVSSLTPGLHTISFTSVTGYTSPTNTYVNISANGNTLTGTYVANVPNGPTLWSTAQILKSGTAWTQETGANVNTGTKTITLTQPAASRYYQLRSGTALTITKVQHAGGNIVLTYQ